MELMGDELQSWRARRIIVAAASLSLVGGGPGSLGQLVVGIEVACRFRVPKLAHSLRV